MWGGYGCTLWWRKRGGIKVDPQSLSQGGELERLSRGYIQGLHKYLGEKN